MKIDTWITEEEIKSRKISSKTFYYTVEYNAKYTRGYNIFVRVYSLKRSGRPIGLGTVEAWTGSYPGNKGLAVSLIGKIFRYRNDGYDIKRNDVNIHQM